MADGESSVPGTSGNTRLRTLDDDNSVVKKRFVFRNLPNTTVNQYGYAEDILESTVIRETMVTPKVELLRKLDFPFFLYWHLRKLEGEVKRRPSPTYMEDIQKDVNPPMREKVIDWLVDVEVVDDFNRLFETLYLTVNYIDRYLYVHEIVGKKLKLVGIACMLVASKNKGTATLSVEEFCYLTENAYAKEEVMEMEEEVLKLLEFDTGTPTIQSFLRVFRVRRFINLCNYVAEMSLLDYGCVCYLPSMIAASAIFLSRFTMQPGEHPWSLLLQQCTGYKPYELKDCILRLHSLQLGRETSARAIMQKYMKDKYFRVESLDPPSKIPDFSFEDPSC